MPLDFRKFRKEIEDKGYSLEMTSKGHYWVITSSGDKLITFAVDHIKNSRGHVFDSYVTKVRRAITNDQ